MPIHNKHANTAPPGSIYIGRGSAWGNPFIIGRDGDRDEVCDLYEEVVRQKMKDSNSFKEDLRNLHEKHLVCFCAPARCHGYTLLTIAAELTENNSADL